MIGWPECILISVLILSVTLVVLQVLDNHGKALETQVSQEMLKRIEALEYKIERHQLDQIHPRVNGAYSQIAELKMKLGVS